MYSCCARMLTVMCFVAIGNAYAVLSNPDKRRHYDQYGEVRSCAGRRRHSERDFQPDISPEDLFNMFFGGGFPSSEYLCLCPCTNRHYLHNFCTSWLDQTRSFQVWRSCFISPQWPHVCIRPNGSLSSDLNIHVLVSWLVWMNIQVFLAMHVPWFLLYLFILLRF